MDKSEKLSVCEEGALKKLYQGYKKIPEYAWVLEHNGKLSGTQISLQHVRTLVEKGYAESRHETILNMLRATLKIKRTKPRSFWYWVFIVPRLLLLTPISILIIIAVYGLNKPIEQFKINESGIEYAKNREKISKLASDLTESIFKSLDERRSAERMKW